MRLARRLFVCFADRLAPLRFGRTGLASNFGWMLAERCWNLISGLVVGFWVVRGLGPEAFGQFSAASSVGAIFAGVATMGIETTVVRRISSNAQDADLIVAASTFLRLLGSVTYVTLCSVAAAAIFPENAEVMLMASILAVAAVFRAMDVVGLRLQAEDHYKAAVLTRTAIRLVGDSIRIGLILSHAPVVWFAVGVVCESLFGFIVFSYLGRAALRRMFAAKRTLVASLFADGRPIIVSGLLSAVYARVDQLALFSIAGAEENGFYAAAVRISEAFNIVALSASGVAAAHFGRLTDAPLPEFEASLRRYYRGMLALGVGVSASLSTFAAPIVKLLYGPNFVEGTAPILRVHAWTFALVCASIALEPWFYHHGRLGAYVPKTLLTLMFALPTVYWATLHLGPVGTATSVVLTYAVSVFATNAILPALRPALRFQLAAFRPQRAAKQ